MAENRRGLGRGLSALLGEAEEITHAGDPAVGVRDIPIELIHNNPDQPRRHFAEAELAELAESISSTFSPTAARAVPRLIAVVVLPTPPFWLAMARTRGRLGALGFAIMVNACLRAGPG